jgi:hypothetical protein
MSKNVLIVFFNFGGLICIFQPKKKRSLGRLFFFQVVFGVFALLASKQPKHGEAFLILANIHAKIFG